MDIQVTDLNVTFTSGGANVTAAVVAELAVAQGAMLAVAGPSGSGKTSLLHALAGLLVPSSGRVCWGHDDLAAMRETARDRFRRQHIGIVFQDFHLIPELSARDNVLLPVWFAARRATKEQISRADALLARMGISTPERKAAVMSRGEQQRVAIARAVLGRPAAILADEPTASLDAASAQVVADLLIDTAREEGTTLIAVSHDPALLARFGTIRRMEQGVLLP